MASEVQPVAQAPTPAKAATEARLGHGRRHCWETPLVTCDVIVRWISMRGPITRGRSDEFAVALELTRRRLRGSQYSAERYRSQQPSADEGAVLSERLMTQLPQCPLTGSCHNYRIVPERIAAGAL
jgi:hypothetical protein